MKPAPLIAACSLALLAGTASAQDAWIVGQSAPLTGSNAAMGRDIRDGALAYFKAVNARGGIAGRPVELVTRSMTRTTARPRAPMRRSC